MRTLCRSIGLLSALLLQVPALGQAPVPSDGSVDASLFPYASTEELVRLADGRTIHLVCMGQGSPTVILAAGGSEWSIFWNTVQPELAAQTQVCSWDRAALGLSSPSPETPLVHNTVGDLESALRVAGISGPFVMVGHSMGGYDSLVFTDRNPGDVIGMVLVDPTPVNDPSAPPDVSMPAIEAVMQGDPPLVGLLQRCADALRDGTLRRGGPDPDNCLSPPPLPANYPQELADAITSARAEVAAYPEANATAMDNYAFYLSARFLEENAPLVFNPQRQYGDMPLIVLSAGEDGSSSRNPPEVNAELPLLLASKQRSHAKLAALSRRGVHRIVDGSDHDIPHRKPQAVVDAVIEVIREARAPL